MKEKGKKETLKRQNGLSDREGKKEKNLKLLFFSVSLAKINPKNNNILIITT